MGTKDINFNADALVSSVETFAHHLTAKRKLTLTSRDYPSMRETKSSARPVLVARVQLSGDAAAN
jgi:hypothetical protein